MKLILRNLLNESIQSIPFRDLHSLRIHENLGRLKKQAKAILYTDKERINSEELLELRLTLEKLNINFTHIYSSNRETVLSGKSLKINSTLINKKDLQNELLQNYQPKQNDILHKGTIRSGNRISSNGDLCVIGDVNPGAIVSAKNNVYVWGKLLGMAFAGEDGNTNASISSLYLNPLQLRICDIIAIGPKEKPKYPYPEVAVLESKVIIIKPLLIAS
mgnify:CR=1 FL=1